MRPTSSLRASWWATTPSCAAPFPALWRTLSPCQPGWTHRAHSLALFMVNPSPPSPANHSVKVNKKSENPQKWSTMENCPVSPDPQTCTLYPMFFYRTISFANLFGVFQIEIICCGIFLPTGIRLTGWDIAQCLSSSFLESKPCWVMFL